MGKYLGDETLYLATERKAILVMLDRTNLNVARAARFFKVCTKTLYRKMAKHGIKVKRVGGNQYERSTKQIQML